VPVNPLTRNHADGSLASVLWLNCGRTFRKTIVFSRSKSSALFFNCLDAACASERADPLLLPDSGTDNIG